MALIPDWLKYEIIHRWEKMDFHRKDSSLREWLQSYSSIIIIITVVCILVLLVELVMITSNPGEEIKEQKKEWYYDLNTKHLFVSRARREVPIKAPSGKLPDGNLAGVRAYVFTYSNNNEPNEAERFIGFLEKPDPNLKGSEPPGNLSGAERWGFGKLIRKEDDSSWVSANSPQGREIMKVLFSPDVNGQTATYCPPLK